MDLTVASSWCYKCFFEPLSSVEAPKLASLSWNGGKGKPLKEYRGEKWFHANWAAKHASKQTWRFTSEVISGCSVDRFQDPPRQFWRVLTCKQSSRYNISLTWLGGPTLIKNLWNGNKKCSTFTVWLNYPEFLSSTNEPSSNTWFWL